MTSRLVSRRLFLGTAAAALASAASRRAPAAPATPSTLAGAAPARQVALTFDDLPFIGKDATLRHARVATAALLGALRAHRAPACGFVTESRLLVLGEQDRRARLLEKWLDGGHELANHGFAHLDSHEVAAHEFEDDVVKGDTVLRALLARRGRAPRFFRFPYNHVGRSREQADAMAEFLRVRGYRVAPFTVETADYMFSAVAESDASPQARRRLAAEYLEFLDTMLDYTERRSEQLFARAIPQVLLLHANALNAELLPAMLGRLEQRGYAFITLEAALTDPAYATAASVTANGMSWLHRWAPALGQASDLAHEPDPPMRVFRAWQALT